MNWIEIITLRSHKNINDPLICELLEPPIKGLESKGLIAKKIYQNAWIENDVSVHLHWKSGPAELRGSAVGMHLVQVLKEFGLVNHSVWVEEKKRS